MRGRLVLVVLVGLVASAAAGAFTLGPSPRGDANGDGVFNVQDVVLTLRAYVAGSPSLLARPDLADVAPDPSADPRGHGDGAIRADDLNRLLRALVGIQPFPGPTSGAVLDPVRQAVLRGLASGRDGAPLRDVTVAVDGHPEYGSAATGPDGTFDLPVNGGGSVTVDYRKAGYLPVQRQVQAPVLDYARLPDVVMSALDPKVTSIDLTSAAVQVAQGSTVTDVKGTRTTTVLFPQGTTAMMVMPDGSRRPLTTLSVRATEYTAGSTDPEALPGTLPPGVSHTYAAEFTADEALTAGATGIVFSQPVVSYVENILHFPVGGPVPAASYDRDRAAWIPERNGRIVAILSVTNGLADLDVDGSHQAAGAAALSALGITDAERARLAHLYAPGASLWRVPMLHFTPWDY